MTRVRAKGGKLQLAKETLRSLSSGELSGVNGGTASIIVVNSAICALSEGAHVCGTVNGTSTNGSASRLLMGCGGTIVIGTLTLSE